MEYSHIQLAEDAEGVLCTNCPWGALWPPMSNLCVTCPKRGRCILRKCRGSAPAGLAVLSVPPAAVSLRLYRGWPAAGDKATDLQTQKPSFDLSHPLLTSSLAPQPEPTKVRQGQSRPRKRSAWPALDSVGPTTTTLTTQLRLGCQSFRLSYQL